MNQTQRKEVKYEFGAQIEEYFRLDTKSLFAKKAQTWFYGQNFVRLLQNEKQLEFFNKCCAGDFQLARAVLHCCLLGQIKILENLDTFLYNFAPSGRSNFDEMPKKIIFLCVQVEKIHQIVQKRSI